MVTRLISTSFQRNFREMYTNEIPFSEKGEQMSLEKLANLLKNKERPSIPSGCPPLLKNLISLCWEHNPSARPDIAAIQKLLTQMREGELEHAPGSLTQAELSREEARISPKRKKKTSWRFRSSKHNSHRNSN